MVGCCLLIGYASGLITQTSINTWYPEIEKPFFTPPNWLFAPVWTLLYITMGIAAGLVWNQIKNHTEEVKKALLFFFVQLAFSVLWVYLFFGLKNLLLASIEIILLLLLVYETYYLFKKINDKAGKLLIPYLLWTGFASLLTLSVFILNFKK